MNVLILTLMVVVTFQQYLKIEAYSSNSTCGIEDEIIVEYFIQLDLCIVSVTSEGQRSEIFTIEGNTTYHYRYEDLSCDNIVSMDQYPLYTCFNNISEDITPSNITSNVYYNLSESDIDFSYIDNVKDWTKLETFSDYICEETLLYMTHPSTIYFKSYNLFPTYTSVVDGIYHMVLSNENELLIVLYSVHLVNSSIPFAYQYFPNLPDGTCSQALSYTFMRSFSVPEENSFRKLSMSQSEFENEAETELECPSFMIESVYYTDTCSIGDPFSFSLDPLKTCYHRRKKFTNETHHLIVYYDDDECMGNIVNIEFGNFPSHGECFPFKQTSIGEGSEEDWGYTVTMTDHPRFSDMMAVILLEGCGVETLEQIDEIKKSRSVQMFFISEDCIREEDWGGLVSTGGAASMRGRCVDGKLEVRNYTFRSTCDNIYNLVEEDFCEFDDNVCNGNGDCTGMDRCECYQGYDGEYCQYEEDTDDDGKRSSVAGVVVGSILGLLLVISCLGIFSTICCFVLLLCMIEICAYSIFFILSMIVFQLISSQRKFKKLKNFDILLKEQQMEDDTSIAHLKINKDLFKVRYEEIEVQKLLGEGGSGSSVFRARWKNVIVAFKCFKTRRLCSKQENFTEFEREVQVMSSISHPNIIRFLGATLDPPRVGILMEFCSNGEVLVFVQNYYEFYSSKVRGSKKGELEEAEKKKHYPLAEKLRLLIEITGAIDYLHSRSILHRDIKSENVLLDANENCKLMDFGLSRQVAESDGSSRTMRIGTNVYIPPEVVLGGGFYNSKCDVFSYAILCWIIMTEEDKPYKGVDVFGIELRVANDPSFRPEISSLKEKYEEWYGIKKEEDMEEEKERILLEECMECIVDICEKCWNSEPEKRYDCNFVCKILNEKRDLLMSDE